MKNTTVMNEIKLKSAGELVYNEDELIITDPPYNIGYKYSGHFLDEMPLDDYQQLFEPMQGHRVVMIHYAENIMRDIIPVLGPPERCVAWTYPSNAGHRQWRCISWWNCTPDWGKDYVPYKNPNDKRVKKLMETRKGRKLPDHWEINLVKNVSKEKVKGYTNQIPQALIERIIRITANSLDTIVDPFCGTGTTAAAAKIMGHRWKTYDINPTAIKLATERINNTPEFPI